MECILPVDKNTIGFIRQEDAALFPWLLTYHVEIPKILGVKVIFIIKFK